MTDTSDMNLSLTRLSAGADLQAYRDTNNNCGIDSYETFVADSARGSSFNELINPTSDIN